MMFTRLIFQTDVENGVISMGTTDKIENLSVSSSNNDGPFGLANSLMMIIWKNQINLNFGTAGNGRIFRDSDIEIGHVEKTKLTSVTFGTTSDYRLKENVDYSWTNLKQD